jgi:copper(I)-binding protein
MVVLAGALLLRATPQAPGQLAGGGVSAAASAGVAASRSPALSQTPVVAGMSIVGARAIPIPGRDSPVIVVATIRNGTGSGDALLGASSPMSSTGYLYATVDHGYPLPTDDGTGMVPFAKMPKWEIPAGTEIGLRAGSGQIILLGFKVQPQVGQTISVTFLFEHASPVTVSVPVTAD